MSATTFASLLAAHGIVDSAAVFDPEGYDGGATMRRISAAAADLRDWIAIESTLRPAPRLAEHLKLAT